jgi:hypothetical protein
MPYVPLNPATGRQLLTFETTKDPDLAVSLVRLRGRGRGRCSSVRRKLDRSTFSGSAHARHGRLIGHRVVGSPDACACRVSCRHLRSKCDTVSKAVE